MSRKKRFKAPGKKQVLGCDFYTTVSGGQPVRTWLKLLKQHDEETVAIIGGDIEAIQWRWPVGLPLVEKLGGKLFAVRSSSSSGEWRVFFTVMGDLMILAARSEQEIEEGTSARHRPCAREAEGGHRMNTRSRYDPRGLQKFLDEEGMADKAHALAAKQIMAEDLRRQMKRKNMSLARLSRQMRTSKTAVYNLLDPNSGGTIDTLFKACSALGLVLAIKPATAPRRGSMRRAAVRSARPGRKIVRRAPVAARECRS